MVIDLFLKGAGWKAASMDGAERRVEFVFFMAAASAPNDTARARTA
jgi:hypothetical protein